MVQWILLSSDGQALSPLFVTLLAYERISNPSPVFVLTNFFQKCNATDEKIEGFP